MIQTTPDKRQTKEFCSQHAPSDKFTPTPFVSIAMHRSTDFSTPAREDFSDSMIHEESSGNTGSEVGTSTSSFQNGAKSQATDDAFVRVDTTAVNRSKCLVYVALLCAATVVSAVTYLILAKEEQNTMRNEFEAYSREILKQATANSNNMFQEIFDISKAITSHALDSEMTWPNVTLPHFDVRATGESSRVEVVGFAPFVSPENKRGWESYSFDNQGWIEEDYFYRGWEAIPPEITKEIHSYKGGHDDPWFDEIRRHLKEYNYSDPAIFEYEIPLWQVSPPPEDTSVINTDLATHPVFAHLLWDVRVKKVKQYSRAIDISFLVGDAADDGHPRGVIFEPVFDDFLEDAEVVGFMMATLNWDHIFENVLFDSVAPLLVEIKGNCSAGFAYALTGDDVIFLGIGSDWHDAKYDKFTHSAPILAPLNSRVGYPEVIHSHRPTDAAHNESHCTYIMHTYPSEDFEESYRSKQPIWFTAVVVGIFLCTVMVFILYDCLVQKRQNKLLSTAKQSNAIVSSLFPEEVREQLMRRAEDDIIGSKQRGRRRAMTDFLDGDVKVEGGAVSGNPIADLFTNATVMFADIVGFTAWGSTREPTQVFLLLETIYAAFDALARKRKVFKVETVGDCYVAVTGVPTPTRDHAILMAKFAKDCVDAIQQVLLELETALGPDTTELGIRIGIHSGPVTAGVLRGDRARFQLFGDTVNTASRIETTGQKNQIHISEETAALLIAVGKEDWMEARKDSVQAKGKGELRTYWLKTGPGSVNSPVDSLRDKEKMISSYGSGQEALSEKHARFVKWISDILAIFLKQIVAKRKQLYHADQRALGQLNSQRGSKKKTFSDDVLGEVQDVIELPAFDPQACVSGEEQNIDLKPEVASKLYEYIYSIASMYSKNPFHNFEHAAHVTMSVVKLLSRIIAPEKIPCSNGSNEASALHDHTYGITSDPLTQFSVILSALIHDLYHPGVTNTVLVKEKTKFAALYKNKSIAEQKSVDDAWQMLMSPTFEELRGAIYCNAAEYNRFRHIVVNCVMATDIMDKDLSAARKARWEAAFTGQTQNESSQYAVNRKATIVIEHLIQASDVVHTMQHWHVYRKWNEKLFQEMFQAYKMGRVDTNPADTWYEGELAFFDYYIIPLAKKLKDCGVFGVSSDEYLSYAEKNCKEWKHKGKRAVSEMLSNFAKDSSSTS